jgi:hypothetical protein
VLRMLRSAPLLRRGALLIRGPCSETGPGSAAHRQGARHRVRDTRTHSPPLQKKKSPARAGGTGRGFHVRAPLRHPDMNWICYSTT